MSQTKEDNQKNINGAGQEIQYDLDLILDIDLNVSVELGKVKMPVKDLLQLGQGSIVELAKSVGEPLDIYVNNTLIAKGEVVILDEKFGIRVADIINPIERVKSLT
ncbi:MAG: flagellar motor switch protein FliN [Deltaproteobacteria bacterium]|jgi:flagellar motor switch protein FliN/FliY|nr:flagellar motor switch protein FliN [Deltaproteobacteria bacterium]MBW1856192.1 flagellar motor switch protein FliN [Deltaproteobacteria bacterium]